MKKHLVIALLFIICFFSFSLQPSLAQNAWQTWDGTQYTNLTGNDPGPASFISLEFIFANILGIVVAFAGLALFVMLLIGGYKYMLSSGDPKKAGEASATISWAIIGLVVLLGVWFIMKFIGVFTGVNVTTFKIPS